MLGLALFESDPDVIDAVTEQRVAYLQHCATGAHAEESQKLLNEVAAARICLLDEARKRAYDTTLRPATGVSEEAETPAETPRAASTGQELGDPAWYQAVWPPMEDASHSAPNAKSTNSERKTQPSSEGIPAALRRSSARIRSTAQAAWSGRSALGALKWKWGGGTLVLLLVGAALWLRPAWRPYSPNDTNLPTAKSASHDANAVRQPVDE